MRTELLPLALEMRDADARTAALGTPVAALMERAGRAVAEAAAGLAGGGKPILVLCGPGNNGGDGFVAARLLSEAGYQVTVSAERSADAMTGEAGEAASRWPGAVVTLDQASPETASCVIDALFGSGLTRDLAGPVADVVARVNASGVPVLAVDVPSGIDADTGLVRGVAIRATRTVALGARKPGHLLLPGRIEAGTVVVADLGIAAETVRATGAQIVANGPLLWGAALPRPARDGHKYDRGHAVVLSGGPAHTGAARLCARAALRAGAGLVTLATSARALAVNASHLTAIMLKVVDDPDELSDLLTDSRFNALALGPALGIGPDTRAWVVAALEADRPTVLDADALTSFAGDAAALAAAIRDGRDAPVVLTPHEGEFQRLFDGMPQVAGLPSRLERARAAAHAVGAVILLKGPDTIVAAPDGRASINENGSPYLATAGSGDVLGGIVAGLLAQGMATFEAASAAVWMHADAAERFGPGLIAEDLPEMLPVVLRALPSVEQERDDEAGDHRRER